MTWIAPHSWSSNLRLHHIQSPTFQDALKGKKKDLKEWEQRMSSKVAIVSCWKAGTMTSYDIREMSTPSHHFTSFHIITGLTLVSSWGSTVNCSHDFVQCHGLTQRASPRIVQVVPNLWMNLHKLWNSYMSMPYERQQSIEIQSHTHKHTGNILLAQ